MPDTPTATLEAFGIFSAAIEAGVPTTIVDANLRITSQLTATASGPMPELPCPGFPVGREEVVPVRSSDPAVSGVLLSEFADRIDRRTVVLRFDNISPADLAAIEDVWDGGKALVRPFELTVPGEGSARSFVFAEDLGVVRGSAVSFQVEIALIDVGAVSQ